MSSNINSLSFSACHDGQNAGLGFFAPTYDSGSMQCNASKLFLDREDGFAVKVLESNTTSNRSFLVGDKLGMGSYLESTTGPSTRIIMIQQQSSWGPLSIGLHGMQQLLAKFTVFHPFIDIVEAFGWKVSSKDESFATLRLQESVTEGIKESTYLAKYAEEHEREEVDEKWSLRKSGVYHRSCASWGDLFIVLNPSRSMQLRFKEMMRSKKQLIPHDVHLAVLAASLKTWRRCTGDIEERCLQMKTKAHLTRVEGLAQDSEKRSSRMEFEDIQDIQVLQDKLEIFQHAVDGNLHVLTHLPQHLTTADIGEFADLKNVAVSERSRIASVLRRLRATSDLVARILDFRCLASMEQNSRILTDLIRVANDENALIVDLGKKASHDADVVKMLTLLALIYLPANFTATVMDMGYISVEKITGSIHLRFEAEFFVFLVLTAIFLVITLGAYFIWFHTRKTSWHQSSASWLRKFGGP